MTVATRKFNPGFLTEDELMASFCVRIHEFESIVETLRGCTGNSNQHQIVIGPRGSGKTTLLLRVAAEIGRDAELCRRLLPVCFAEESYEVSTAGEFWLECLAQLSNQAPSEEDGRDLPRTLAEFRTIQDDRTLADRCLGALLDYADRQGKRLVLLVENLNMMFRDMVDPDAGWRLRHTLQTESRIVLLASATSRFDEIDSPDSALYELHRVHTLAPLDTDECMLLWEAESGESPSRDEVRPLEILTGGSPRLLAIVARMGAGRSLGDLLDQLLDLIDDHTEYFKSHIEALPAQERRVYLALAELWEPATTKEVAGRARLDTNKCSAQLKRLSDRGAVRVVGGSSRRKQFYLTERLYNIYYLLRRHQRPERLVRALLRFMSSYYSGVELAAVMTEFVKDTFRPRREVSALRAGALKQLPDLVNVDPGASGCTSSREKALLGFVAALGQVAYYRGVNRLEEALGACDAMLAALETADLPGGFWSARTLSEKADLLRILDRYEEAIAVCDEALGLPEPGERETAAAHDFFNTALVDVIHTKATSLCGVGRNEDAADAYLEVDRRFGESENMSHRMDAAAALISRAMILDGMGLGREVLRQCDSVVNRFGRTGHAEMEGWVGNALQIKGLVLDRLAKPQEALAAVDESLRRFEHSDLPRTDSLVVGACLNRGTLLRELGDEDAARAAYTGVLARLDEGETDAAAEWKATVRLMLGSLELDCEEYGSASRLASEVLASRSEVNLDHRVGALLLRARAALFDAPEAALSDLAAALEVLPTLDSLPVETFAALVEAAVELGPARVLELIGGSASAESLLPLATALELELGRAPGVAREVEEVAKDIRRSLAAARRKRAATDGENPRPEREEPS